ncbi:hypothetical protein AC578_1490 [Pseudocercospora eumusae]|uniref:Uncharacterized protein n=1 Tax=Pseudocercospora eumusae TaxID=321146 RepID=A0A139H5F8_9PEZI|nr:hypothetical protein AC578_1490 [Pseudocercospora eumusae]
MAGLLENEEAVLELRASLDGMNHEQRIAALKQRLVTGTKETQSATSKLHAAVTIFIESDREEWERWVKGFGEGKTLLGHLCVANSSYQEASRCRDGIRQAWPAWDWTLQGREPNAWTLRMLKPLAWLARRCETWQHIVAFLVAIIKDRVENRAGRQGSSKEPTLCSIDVQRLAASLKTGHRLETEIDLSNISVDSAPSPETGRVEEKPLDDMSSFLQQSGFEPSFAGASASGDFGLDLDLDLDANPAGEGRASQPPPLADDPARDSPPRPPRQPRQPRQANPARDAERLISSLRATRDALEARMLATQDLEELVLLHPQALAAREDLRLFEQAWARSSLGRR